jgi:hypothetical protein
MKQASTRQEILLIKNSSISKMSFIPLESRPEGSQLTPADQLEEYCWNGMLDSFAPGLVDENAIGKKLIIWHIQQTRAFLHLDLCEQKIELEGRDSIDPYHFLDHMQYN